MKQITHKEATAYALRNKIRLADEMKFCQEFWIIANAPKIARIESGRCDKTHFGDYPHGWKKAMIVHCGKEAERNIVDEFISDNCDIIDGALWLNKWSVICDSETTTP